MGRAAAWAGVALFSICAGSACGDDSESGARGGAGKGSGGAAGKAGSSGGVGGSSTAGSGGGAGTSADAGDGSLGSGGAGTGGAATGGTSSSDAGMDGDAAAGAAGATGDSGDPDASGADSGVDGGIGTAPTGFRCQLLADARPGSRGSDPSQLVAVGAGAFFVANDGTIGPELWYTDGTPAGTRLLSDINPGAGGGIITSITKFGAKVMFGAYSPTTGRELYQSDGTASGTGLLADINAGSGDSRPSDFLELGGTLYFTACTASAGCELFRSDGTTAGTSLVRDFDPGSSSSQASPMFVLGGKLYLRAEDPAVGDELWVSDGTLAGTTLLVDAKPGPPGLEPALLGIAGGTVFLTSGFAIDPELWKTDGTAAGTVQIQTSVVPQSRNAMAQGNLLLFQGLEGGLQTTIGTELYVSDGTSAGTKLLRDIFTGDDDSLPGDFFGFQGQAHFLAAPRNYGRDLFVTDGTTQGTRRVLDMPGNGALSEVVPFAGTLLVSGFSPETGAELFFPDGDWLRTAWEFAASETNSHPNLLEVAEDNVYLVADDGVHGEEVYRCFIDQGAPSASCGNAAVDDPDEHCDGSVPAGADCAVALGRPATGTLGCTATCRFDVASCSYCGDGSAAGSESCDGSDLRGRSCASIHGTGATGSLQCSSSCRFDPSGCTPPAVEPPSCAARLECAEKSCCDAIDVPGGSYLMGRGSGSDAFTSQASADTPEHSVTVSSFRLDRFEVSAGRLQAFVEQYSGPPAARAGAHPLIAGSGWQSAWNANLPATRDDLSRAVRCHTYSATRGDWHARAATCIDWYVGFAFCAWDGGRLPTEAEWELAAAGGTENRLYPWGAAEPATSLASYYCQVDGFAGCGATDILPVGSLPGGDGRYGHRQLAGNVREWALDFFDPDFFTGAGATCTDCANLVAVPLWGRVSRGGGWEEPGYKDAFRAAARGQEYSGYSQGVRCARDP